MVIWHHATYIKTTQLAMRILFGYCLCKVRSRVSDALWQSLCNLSLAFLAALIRFIPFANYTLIFVWIERQDHSIHMSSVLQVQQLYTLWAYLCWRHNYCQWPIIKLAKKVSPKNKMAANHSIHSLGINKSCCHTKTLHTSEFSDVTTPGINR